MDPARIQLRDLTTENFDDVIALAVAEDQRDFLNSNVESIAWAYVAPESHPFVIYDGDTPVGLASYGYVPDDGRCWIMHLMVDHRRQREGIGRIALEQLLARMNEVSGGAKLLVPVNPANAAAIHLYESLGFEDTGRRQGGELILGRTDEPGGGDPATSSRAGAQPDRSTDGVPVARLRRGSSA